MKLCFEKTFYIPKLRTSIEIEIGFRREQWGICFFPFLINFRQRNIDGMVGFLFSTFVAAIAFDYRKKSRL